MRIFLYWILLVIFCGCSVRGPRQNYKTCEKDTYANEIQHKVANQLKRDFDLIPFGSGAQMMYQIEMLHLAFQYAKPVTIESARTLAVVAVDEFVAAINADERIRPFLANYPFEPKNIEIEIYIIDSNGRKVTPGELCLISAYQGSVEYVVNDPVADRQKTIHQESFDDAVELVAHQRGQAI